MLFHHKTHKIRSKDVLPNKKINNTKTVKFSPKYHLFYFPDNSNSICEICKKIYIIIMHTRCCRGRVDKKFKIFNNTTDRGKSERKKSKQFTNLSQKTPIFVLRITPFLFTQAISSFHQSKL